MASLAGGLAYCWSPGTRRGVEGVGGRVVSERVCSTHAGDSARSLRSSVVCISAVVRALAHRFIHPHSKNDGAFIRRDTRDEATDGSGDVQRQVTSRTARPPPSAFAAPPTGAPSSRPTTPPRRVSAPTTFATPSPAMRSSSPAPPARCASQSLTTGGVKCRGCSHREIAEKMRWLRWGGETGYGGRGSEAGAGPRVGDSGLVAAML